jgi:hypothetical protein
VTHIALPLLLIYFFLFRKYKVFTIVNPVGASKPPSYLHRWNSKSYTIEQGVAVIGSLSALAVTDNGNYVATGSMFDGTVEIYTTFNLAVSVFCLRKFKCMIFRPVANFGHQSLFLT